MFTYTVELKIVVNLSIFSLEKSITKVENIAEKIANSQVD